MTILKTLREILGISQRQLAAFIGGDRTLLVRAENGERNLGNDAALQLALMIPSYSHAKQQPIPITPGNEILQQLLQHAGGCRHKAVVLKKKQTQMRIDYEKSARLMIFIQQLQFAPNHQYTARQTRWLEQRLYEAGKCMKESGPTQQLLLQLKIQTLEMEAEIYETQHRL